MKIFPQEDNFFGLDLGTSSIKLTQLRQLHGRPNLVTYGDIEIPENLVSSSSDIDQTKLAGLINQLAADAKVTSKNVVASLNAAQSYTAIIQTPKLSHEELSESIHFQAEKVIPMAIDQIKLDWAVVGEDVEAEELDVLLVATPNVVANRYLALVQKAGFELLALEINSIAQARSLVRPTDREKCLILIDMGMQSCDIAIIEDMVPHLVRSTTVGSRVFMRSIMQNLSIDEEQADQFMRKFGMDQSKVEGQVYKTLKPNVDQLIDEINKSIEFFQDKNKDVKVEKIILTGGTTAMPGLPLYIANSTGLTVEIGNAWQNISYPAELESNLAALSLSYGTAIGLSLRGFKL